MHKHKYCTDQVREKNRQRVTKFLYLVAIPVTSLLNEHIIPWILNKMNAVVCLENAIEWLVFHKVLTLSVSYVGVFALLYWLVDRVLWGKCLACVFQMPDIRGVWSGELQSSYGNDTKIQMELYIDQGLHDISILAFFINSKEEITSSSYSVMAYLIPEGNGNIQLTYVYKNESEIGQRYHDGLSHFSVFVMDGYKMIGDYITNRPDEKNDSLTRGKMELMKCSNSEAKKKKKTRKIRW